MKPRYSFIDSAGPHTNLQLRFLDVAEREWNRLVEDLRCDLDADQVNEKERLVLVCVMLGLSASQLMGRNLRGNRAEKTPPPKELFKRHMELVGADPSTVSKLRPDFESLIDVYDSSRHFGETPSGSHYRRIDGLTRSDVSRFINVTLRIWDLTIAWFQKESSPGSLELRSIEDHVHFKRLKETP